MVEQEKIVENAEQDKSVESKEQQTEKKEVLGLASEILGELHTQNKRMARIVYSLLIMIVAIIAGFLLYLYQYDFASYEIISEDGGNANYIGNDGDIYNGEAQGSY